MFFWYILCCIIFHNFASCVHVSYLKDVWMFLKTKRKSFSWFNNVVLSFALASTDHIVFRYYKNAAIIVTVKMKCYQLRSLLQCSYSFGILIKFWLAHISFCPGLALSVTQSCFWLSHCLSLSPFHLFLLLSLLPALYVCLSLLFSSI